MRRVPVVRAPAPAAAKSQPADGCREGVEALCRVLASNAALRALDVSITSPESRAKNSVNRALAFEAPSDEDSDGEAVDRPPQPQPPDRLDLTAEYGHVAEALAGNSTLRAFAISGLMCVHS